MPITKTNDHPPNLKKKKKKKKKTIRDLALARHRVSYVFLVTCVEAEYQKLFQEKICVTKVIIFGGKPIVTLTNRAQFGL